MRHDLFPVVEFLRTLRYAHGTVEIAEKALGRIGVDGLGAGRLPRAAVVSADVGHVLPKLVLLHVLLEIV